MKKVRRNCQDYMIETLSDLLKSLDFIVKVLGKTCAPNFMFIMFVEKRESSPLYRNRNWGKEEEILR